MQIVIDKSFLRASPTFLVHRLCEDHRVLFVENLLFELMDGQDRVECFAKLPSGEDDVLCRLKALCSSIFDFWPELKDDKGRIPNEKILKIAVEVASEQDMVRAFWDIIRPVHFLPGDVIGPKWVIFRWTQLRVLLCLDWARRHPVIEEADNVKLEHDLHDFCYVLFASLAGALASCDNKQIDILRLVRPNSYILTGKANLEACR